MILRKIIIEFTDDPNDIDNYGVGTYKNLPNGDKVIRAYCQEDTSKWRLWSFGCAMHELTEFELIDLAGIPEEEVDKFDKWYNEQGFEQEPGDHDLSPYKTMHRSSEMVERYLIERFGLDWFDYAENYVIPKDFKYNDNYGKD
jgi:hypothetical protein